MVENVIKRMVDLYNIIPRGRNTSGNILSKLLVMLVYYICNNNILIHNLSLDRRKGDSYDE